MSSLIILSHGHPKSALLIADTWVGLAVGWAVPLSSQALELCWCRQEEAQSLTGSAEPSSWKLMLNAVQLGTGCAHENHPTSCGKHAHRVRTQGAGSTTQRSGDSSSPALATCLVGVKLWGTFPHTSALPFLCLIPGLTPPVGDAAAGGLCPHPSQAQACAEVPVSWPASGKSWAHPKRWEPSGISQ